MGQRSKKVEYLLLSPSTHQKAIGFLGFLLPVVLSLVGWLLFQSEIQRSISAYYYTKMGDYFVGTLWAIGFGLLAYRGYEPTEKDWLSDNAAANLGCFFAVCVALFPTTKGKDLDWFGAVHLTCAALLFAVLIYFSWCLFTRTDQEKPKARKRQRNLVYKLCASIMFVGIGLVGVYFVLLSEAAVLWLKPYNPVFWLEAVAVWSFAISWLTKAEVILWDQDQDSE